MHKNPDLPERSLFMKRLLSSILASSLILSSLSLSFATETTQTNPPEEILQQITTQTLSSSLSPEVAAAYVGVIETIIAIYGDDPVLAVWEPDYEKGLISTKLVNFNNDGSPELYVFYTPIAEDGNRIYREEFWGFHDNKVEKLYTNDKETNWSTAVRDTGTYLTSYEGRTVWVRYYSLFHRGHQYYDVKIYEYENGLVNA